MRKRWAYWSGVVLIAVALVAFPSAAVLVSYAGGSAVAGGVVDGRHFVNPQHGQPTVEVSAALWVIVYWAERLWPWSAILPVWAAIFLMGYARGADERPQLPAATEIPEWMFWVVAASIEMFMLGTALFWRVVRVPWATMLVAYVLFLGSIGVTCVVWAISGRRPPNQPGSN